MGALEPDPWVPGRNPLVVGAAFVAFARGEAGPGEAGDHAVVGAVAWSERDGVVAGVVVDGVAAGPYVPGLLGLREGAMTEAALAPLLERVEVDVLVLDATGRDHPRRCGLALHLGWLLGRPSVGVTHRMLTDRHHPVPPSGATGTLEVVGVAGEAVAAWVATVGGVRPVVVHAGWRTSVEVAAEVVGRCARGARTPEPLRRARELARTARADR